tara:strand:+ start:1556 stop:1936 length:381 start_codon:yes stop_codon:yes gene_type:complete
MKHLPSVIIMTGMMGVLYGFSQPVYSASVVPNFTRGTVTSDTTSTQTIVESIHEVQYATGDSYTVTGTNILIPENPTRGTLYTQIDPTAPFQFTETYSGPGITKETWIDRTITTESTTNTMSVFTQ